MAINDWMRSKVRGAIDLLFLLVESVAIGMFWFLSVSVLYDDDDIYLSYSWAVV